MGLECPQKSPVLHPLLESVPCWRDTALAHQMTKKSLGCCTSRTCWAVLGCWQLLQGRCWMLDTA